MAASALMYRFVNPEGSEYLVIDLSKLGDEEYKRPGYRLDGVVRVEGDALIHPKGAFPVDVVLTPEI